MVKRLVAVLLLSLGFVGCGLTGAPGAGATPGGAQDIALARRKIADGLVPNPEDFVAEGLYSEHDLPLEGPPCDQVLCLGAAMAVAPAIDTGRQEFFVQVGLSSNVDMASFRRGPLDVALLIDKSCSMSDGKLEAVKAAAHKLVEKLDGGDTFSLVAFDDSADRVLGQEPVTDKQRLLAVIDRLQTEGGTCIECGLRMSFEQLASVSSSPRSKRVFLFTDALPNVGATGEGEFTELLESNAREGREATIFGVGIDFGQQLAARISRVRGANYFYLYDDERISKVFDEDLDFLVTPIAHDLRLQLTPAEGRRVEAVYGVPGIEPGATDATLEVATVFLSRRRGAILARLSGPVEPQQPAMSGALSYRTLEGSQPRVTFSASYEGSEPLEANATWASQRGVRKTVALTQLILGARKACELWWSGERASASELAERTATLLAAEAQTLDDDGLRAEAALARKLADLMRQPEPGGTGGTQAP